MKIKKTDLENIDNVLDEVSGFLSAFLDFANDDQVEYTYKLLDNIRNSQDKIKEAIK